MSVRLTWTNNSAGHDGTRIYRDTAPMDPQALPAPIAEVAAGVTEYIDSDTLADGAHHYLVQDYAGADVSAVSSEVTVDIGFLASIGDEIGGGIYGGTHSNGTETWHLVFAKQDGESAAGPQWGNYGTTTGATDPDDGLANQELVLTSFDNGDSDAFYHCRDYVDGAGNNDYYLPSRNEIAKADALVSMSHAEFSTDLSTYRWSSTESSSTDAWHRRFSDGSEGSSWKTYTVPRVRPVRRVPA